MDNRRKLHRNLAASMSPGAQYFYDPEIDDDIIMECPHCGTRIPYGSETCPSCGQHIHDTAPQVRQAKARKTADRLWAVIGCAAALIVVVWALIVLR